MLEYFTYKKAKKHQAEKEKRGPTTQTRTQTEVRTPSPAQPSLLLNDEDANFLERIVSAEGPPPPLPNRPEGWVQGVGMEAGDSSGNQAQMVVHDGNGTATEYTAEHHHSWHKDKGKGKEKMKTEEKKPGRLAILARNVTKKYKDHQHPSQPAVSSKETTKEEDDINRVLEDLNLAAVNNRVFSLSKESQQLVQQFTVILKDLINGVPTAYDDLTHLLDDKQGTLSKSYDSLPSFLKKLIAQLPEKMKGNLAPELLAVASEAAALNGKGGAATAGATSFSGAAKAFLKPTSLKDLVTKPGAIVSMLKAIMNALKLRWPAFMGTNVLLSLGLFVLLFVFWYCHKRGREVRLEKEGKAMTIDSEGRVVELDDDPMLSSSRPSAPRSQTERPTHHRRSSDREHHTSSRDRVQSERPQHSRRHSDDREQVHMERRPNSRPTSSRLRTEEGRERRKRSDEVAMSGGR